MRSIILLVLLSSVAQAQFRSDGATASFLGSLPPKPTANLGDDQVDELNSRLASLTKEFASVNKHSRAADAEIFLKAVRYAIEFHEWYDKKAEDGLKKATALLDEAESRIGALKKNKTPWMEGNGQKILGFYSQIDDSSQPYGVEIPDDLAFGSESPKVPMWVWLHGRGDTTTDLHFIYNRLLAKKPGQFQPKGTIVIHPFGRYCNGWKSAGETDVFEARDDAIARFNIDRDRIAIAGFSMGGAGAWHIGAHFADQWACVHTGAGFVDVKRYQKITVEKLPPWYEQKLWGVYDVPNYARNFLNVPLISYSGEIDPQRDSADYMMEVLDKEGLHPPHLIGPGMGHKYHPEVIKEVQSKIEAAVAAGLDREPKTVSIQTRTLAYNRMHWLSITSMENQWEEARADATWDKATNEIKVKTSNVTGLEIALSTIPKVFINDIEVKNAYFNKASTGAWSWEKDVAKSADSLSKHPHLQGPIDDGFKSRFLIVLPDTTSTDSAVGRWIRDESTHFLVRWRSLMRGDPIVRKASEVTEQEIKDCHLVLWGTPATNSLIGKIVVSESIANLLTWNDQEVTIGKQKAVSDHCVPVFCYPNPLNPNRYVIVNSGLTFRESQDKTNSLQNPKLPDWAILDVTDPPSSESAGKVVAADFFDNNWKVVDRVKAPTDR